jgi:hypothetical protein
MTDAQQIAERYINTWNEIDPESRNALLADGWTKNATYVDPLAVAEGHAQISALIGAIHARFPGFRFALSGTVDGYADKLRFSWTLGPDSQPDMIMGSDFVLCENGQLKSVTGFLDKVPAEA